MKFVIFSFRPLTGAHKTYARSDTHYLLHCYDQLRKKLLEQGDAANNLLEHVYNESAQTCLTVSFCDFFSLFLGND